ncbi:isoaspartyl peptidase/L-asparaginase [Sphingomonas swuensis]|uniref:Isoaspartyl peptidase/L-asparaginase n=1 Tax=Sphingomonas swuensis TaxID=977800 RepID=A0ABP7SAW1_9SPHN
MTNWSLVVHGGSGALELSTEEEAAGRAGLNAALDAGEAVLKGGGSAVDAVEAAVRVLEDDPAFNAGRGSVLTAEGKIELDAAIMEGRERHAGAIAGLTTVRNPIGAARAVMDHSPHVMLSHDGAEEFAATRGLETVDPSWFEIPARREALDKVLASGAGFDLDVKYGTVGAVAVDRDGHVAAATSTGGLTAKRFGRIGDSPLIGSGTYADDRACAVSCTGAGELFIRAAAAHEVGARMRLAGESLQDAVDDVLADVLALGGKGGMIAVAPSGEAAWGYTTRGMYRGRASAEGEREVAVHAA